MEKCAFFGLLSYGYPMVIVWLSYGEISIKATPEVEISGVGLCITVYVRGVNDGENVAFCLCGNPVDVRLLA